RVIAVIGRNRRPRRHRGRQGSVARWFGLLVRSDAGLTSCPSASQSDDGDVGDHARSRRSLPPWFMMQVVKRIPVRLKSNGYNVLVGRGLLQRAGREIRRHLPSAASRVFVVTSPNVRRHWGDALEKSLGQAKLQYAILEMNDGEPAKRLESVEQLAERMVAAGADRKSLVVAFGGGVVGDCAGFLAAIFLR